MALTKSLPRPKTREVWTAHSHVWLPFLYSNQTLCLAPGREAALRSNGLVSLRAITGDSGARECPADG